MRVLALDVGDRRIGLAVGDADGATAAPLKTIARRGGDADRVAIADIVRQTQASLVVVGYPTAAERAEGSQARRTREFAERLSQALTVPVELVDESGSSQAAAQASWLAGGARRARGARRRADVDGGAAVIILRRYIDRHAGGPR